MKKAGFLLSEDDRKNLATTEKIVLERFGLDSSSREYFNNQIENPDLSEVFFDAFEKFGSSRIVLDIPDEVEANMDYGWSNIFTKRFASFVEKHGLTYGDYKNNKIEVEKNTFKISKALAKFYKEKVFEHCETILKDMQDVNDGYGFINSAIGNLRYGSDISFLNNSDVLRLMRDYIKFKDNLRSEQCENKKDLTELIDNYHTYINNSIEEQITYFWNECSRSKISKNNELKLVISFNYADWFLCSTGESWGSCLNLSGNSANYWYGLPGLMGDKNRVMIYITTGEKKNCYGIQTDKFLYRTWALLDSDGKLNVVRWFPNESIGNDSLYDLIERETGWKVNRYKTLAENHEFESLYSLELIYTNDDISLFPYLDYADFTSGDTTHIVSGDSGMLHKVRGSGYVCSDEYYNYDDFCSLNDLIDSNTNICDAKEVHRKCCEHCSRNIHEDEEYFTPDGESICERCFSNNYFICEHCGESEHIDNGIYVDEVGYVCNDACFHDHYFMCELTNETCDLDDAVQCCDDREGKNTFLASSQAAESNGYILNEADDTYYKSEFMICDKNGDYIHVNDYENQMELEFEEAV